MKKDKWELLQDAAKPLCDWIEEYGNTINMVTVTKSRTVTGTKYDISVMRKEDNLESF